MESPCLAFGDLDFFSHVFVHVSAKLVVVVALVVADLIGENFVFDAEDGLACVKAVVEMFFSDELGHRDLTLRVDNGIYAGCLEHGVVGL